MKIIRNHKTRFNLILGLILIMGVSCEREFTEDVVFATMPTNGDIFIDGFTSGDLNYAPYSGSYLEAFTVDTETKYAGSAGMRFDIPNVGDPNGTFAGAAFFLSSGRNLTGYDALTFWAKGSEGRTINEIGFGQDFGENKYQVEVQGSLQLTTNWRKYIIPIPDPSKLFTEKGMFWYAEGPNDDGTGWTFWIDELQFEKLGTLAQAQPAIFNGEDRVANGFTGIDFPIVGLTQTFNSGTGQNITVNAAPAYYDFFSSNENIAFVNESGVTTIVSEGTTSITASLNGVLADGSLALTSTGSFDFAPTPTRPAQDVISVFSDAYNNVPVDYYNGFFTPDGQTTQGGEPPAIFGNEEIINYTDLNFVGIGTFLNVSPINASQMTHLHLDINVREAIDSGDQLTIQLLNDVGGNESSGSVVLNSSQLLSNEWASFDIALDAFGLPSRSELGLLFFISNNSSNIPTISNIFVDNIYYYRE